MKDTMHLDEGKCADCGHKLDPGFETDSCNTALNEYAKPCHRPYFCSEECAERAINLSKINADLDRQEDDIERTAKGDAEESDDWSKRADIYIAGQQKIRELRAGRPQTFQWQVRDAYRTYFMRYFTQSAQIDAARRKQQSDKEHAKSAANHASFIAKAEIASQRRAEKEAELDRKEAIRQAAEEIKAEKEAYRLRVIPLEIPSDHSRYEGVHVLGPAGSGKTTLLQEFLIHDILREDSPGLIVLDPKGTLIDRLKSFKALDPSRVVIIDATHPQPAKLGLFVKSANSAVNSEQVLNQAISTYKYIFEASRFSFTPKQGILFEYLVRFMFETGGTLSTLMEFLRVFPKDPNQYAPQLDRMPEDVRDFFRHDFRDSYLSTAQEIGVRLQQIKQKPILRTMFDTTERTIDFFDCMQKRKIVLVNSGMSLDPDTSRMIGRFVIAMVLNAVYVRATMPKSEWHPTFLMIDEFQEFVDAAKTPELLRFPREYNLGTMILHHNMYAAELDEAVRVAISTNTGIKFCADPRGMDLNYMARDFDCETDLLRRQQVDDTHVHFAHVMRRKHSTAVTVSVPRGNLDAYPKRDKAAVAAMDAANATMVHFSPEVVLVSRDEWIDHLQSGNIDEEGRSLDPRCNTILQVDDALERWHVDTPHGSAPSPRATAAAPPPAPAKTTTPILPTSSNVPPGKAKGLW